MRSSPLVDVSHRQIIGRCPECGSSGVRLTLRELSMHARGFTCAERRAVMDAPSQGADTGDELRVSNHAAYAPYAAWAHLAVTRHPYQRFVSGYVELEARWAREIAAADATGDPTGPFASSAPTRRMLEAAPFWATPRGTIERAAAFVRDFVRGRLYLDSGSEVGGGRDGGPLYSSSCVDLSEELFKLVPTTSGFLRDFEGRLISPTWTVDVGRVGDVYAGLLASLGVQIDAPALAELTARWAAANMRTGQADEAAMVDALRGDAQIRHAIDALYALDFACSGGGGGPRSKNIDTIFGQANADTPQSETEQHHTISVCPVEVTNCVPVVGIPAFKGAELLWRSVRSAAPFACTLVIVQNGRDSEVERAIVEMQSEFGDQLRVIKFAINEGVAAAWNAIIKAVPEAPYWLITNSDVAFRPETLNGIRQELDQRLTNGTGPGQTEGLIQFGFEVPSGVQYGFVAFALSRETIEQVGFFDQNIFPAYHEDTEYAIRMGTAKLEIGMLETHTIIHGDEKAHNYKSGTMQATASNDAFRLQSERANNNIYVAKKWGLGINPTNGALQALHADGMRNGSSIAAAQYETPWGDPNLALRNWTLDPGRHHFIRTGEKDGMYAHLVRTRAECTHTPPQLVILGMHHSGTSLLSGLLQGAGIYTGNEMGSTGSADGTQLNPNGYYEDSQLYQLNEEYLRKRKWSWFDFCGFNVSSVFDNTDKPLNSRTGWQSLVARFRAHAPSSMKDPRLCITLSAIRHLFDNPVCIILTRDVLQVNRSVHHWTPNVASKIDPIAMRDLYVLSSLQACTDLPTYRVDHSNLMKDPKATVSTLLTSLNNDLCKVQESGPQDAFYRPLSKDAVDALWSPKLNFHKGMATDEEIRKQLPLHTRLLDAALNTSEVFAWSRQDIRTRIGSLNVCLDDRAPDSAARRPRKYQPDS